MGLIASSTLKNNIVRGKTKAIIVDVDGTITNNEHRVHLIKGDNPDWDRFYLEACNDYENNVVLSVLKSIHDNEFFQNDFEHCRLYFIFITGRIEKLRKLTELQIKSFLNMDKQSYHLGMRIDGDYSLLLNLKCNFSLVPF